MPIRKFRRIEDMPDATWYAPGDPRLFRAIAAVLRFSAMAFPRHFPPGVYKHRSVEEMSRATDAWHAADFARHQRTLREPRS